MIMLYIMFKATNASIGEKSIIPIGGIIFLKSFKYGSQISLRNLDTIFSGIGNQLDRMYRNKANW